MHGARTVLSAPAPSPPVSPKVGDPPVSPVGRGSRCSRAPPAKPGAGTVSPQPLSRVLSTGAVPLRATSGPPPSPAQPCKRDFLSLEEEPVWRAIPKGGRCLLPVLPKVRGGFPCVAEPSGKEIFLSSNLSEDRVMYSPVTNLVAAIGLLSHLQYHYRGWGNLSSKYLPKSK